MENVSFWSSVKFRYNSWKGGLHLICFAIADGARKKMQRLHLQWLECEMQSGYCVHVKAVAGNSDVRLRTDPTTLASVYEEAPPPHQCLSATLVPCEIRLCGAHWSSDCCRMPATARAEAVCVQAGIQSLLIGYPGQKTLSFDFCMACAVLSLAFQFNLFRVGGVQWGEICLLTFHCHFES